MMSGFLERNIDVIKNYINRSIPYPVHIDVSKDIEENYKFYINFEPSKTCLKIRGEERIIGNADQKISEFISEVISEYISGFENQSKVVDSPGIYKKYNFKVLNRLHNNTIYVNQETYEKMMKDNLVIGTKNHDTNS